MNIINHQNLNCLFCFTNVLKAIYCFIPAKKCNDKNLLLKFNCLFWLQSGSICVFYSIECSLLWTWKCFFGLHLQNIRKQLQLFIDSEDMAEHEFHVLCKPELYTAKVSCSFQRLKVQFKNYIIIFELTKKVKP